MPRPRSFPPLARASAHILILGSMPGTESLRRRQYYAHPHNQFWPIMGALFGAHRELPYAQRVAILLDRDVAVWDVLKQCQRAGSLDGNIVRTSEIANDFARFFKKHPGIRIVFFNGGHAESAFRRLVLPHLGERAQALRFVRLPSTSPAHAAMARAAKLEAWRRVTEAR